MSPRKYVRGGHGDDCRRIGRELLQPVGRWTPHRKLHLLEGIAAGHITRAEAMAAHGISAEEIGTWMRRAVGGPRSLAEDACEFDPVARRDRAQQLADEIVQVPRLDRACVSADSRTICLVLP